MQVVEVGIVGVTGVREGIKDVTMITTKTWVTAVVNTAAIGTMVVSMIKEAMVGEGTILSQSHQKEGDIDG